MLFEMHTHTSEHSSCSQISAIDLVRQILARGLQGLVITDHHYHWSDSEIAELRIAAGAPAYFIILSGQEVTTPRFGDVLVYGASRTIPPGTTVEAIRHDFPDAAVVWAHPYRGAKTPSADMLNSPLIHAVEIFNSNHTVRENRQALTDWHLHKFTALAGTDTHAATYAGAYPTHFTHPVRTMADLVTEIRSGRCRPFFSETILDGANTKVVEVAIGLSPEARRQERMIIKATETEEKWQAANRAFHIMKTFSEAGFSNDTFRVPQALDEDTKAHTVVEEFIDGKSLYDTLHAIDEEEGRRLLRLTGQWLARLHNMEVRLNTPREFLEKELQRLARYVEYFSSAKHRHTRKAREVAEHLADEVRGVIKNERFFVQGHGDFHPKNIVIGRGTGGSHFIAAIDFDSSYTQPPSFDIGYFLAQMRNQFFDREDIRRSLPERLFLDAYAEAGGFFYEGFHHEIEIFTARTNLNIASFLVWLGKGNDEAVWRLLVEADRILSTGVSAIRIV